MPDRSHPTDPISFRRPPGVLLVAGAGALLASCDGVQSALEPNGPVARAEANLYWVMTVISTVVVVGVVALLFHAIRRHRNPPEERPPLPLAPKAEKKKAERLEEGDGGSRTAFREIGKAAGDEDEKLTVSDDAPLPVVLDTEEEDRKSVRWIVAGGVVFPAVVLVGVFLYTLNTLALVAGNEEPADLTVEVIGWQWWWEVHYYGSDGRRLFETANEIHVPAGKRVRFLLRSADVIHSFWAPQLAGKLDMVPGRTNAMWLEADEPGVYRGQCAEYCETQHAKMAFLVIAQPEEEFDEWAALQARDAREPDGSLEMLGREVFLEGCAACHTVRGTPAVGNLGPDLTHLASRRTLAAVTIPNTRGHLGGWITNPQSVKLGANMPAVPMESEALVALLHYLESLR